MIPRSDEPNYRAASETPQEEPQNNLAQIVEQSKILQYNPDFKFMEIKKGVYVPPRLIDAEAKLQKILELNEKVTSLCLNSHSGTTLEIQLKLASINILQREQKTLMEGVESDLHVSWKDTWNDKYTSEQLAAIERLKGVVSSDKVGGLLTEQIKKVNRLLKEIGQSTDIKTIDSDQSAGGIVKFLAEQNSKMKNYLKKEFNLEDVATDKKYLKRQLEVKLYAENVKPDDAALNLTEEETGFQLDEKFNRLVDLESSINPEGSRASDKDIIKDMKKAYLFAQGISRATGKNFSELVQKDRTILSAYSKSHRFVVLNKLGQGAFKEVFRAYDKTLQKTVAMAQVVLSGPKLVQEIEDNLREMKKQGVKFLNGKEIPGEGSPLWRQIVSAKVSEKQRQRSYNADQLEQEVVLRNESKGEGDSKHLTTVENVGKDRIYKVIMGEAHFDGRALLKKSEEVRSDPVVRSWFQNPQIRSNIATQVVSELQKSHLKGILHRDVKPENFLCTVVSQRATTSDGKIHSQKVPKLDLEDFGLAFKMENKNAAKRLAGTPDFMSPDFLERPEATQKSDIFSLGMTLFEMFSNTLFSPDIKRNLERIRNEWDPENIQDPHYIEELRKWCDFEVPVVDISALQQIEDPKETIKAATAAITDLFLKEAIPKMLMGEISLPNSQKALSLVQELVTASSEEVINQKLDEITVMTKAFFNPPIQAENLKAVEMLKTAIGKLSLEETLKTFDEILVPSEE